MDEKELIALATAWNRRDSAQRNKPFECDAELLSLDGRLWALTLDQFSPEEDLFSDRDPVLLGANLAVATLSDLLAAGAEPKFFMQGLTVPKEASTRFVSGVAEGIRSVLEESGAFLCGGDMGIADQWRFTGFAMGPVRDQRPLTRILPPAPCSLWVTGNLGDANSAAWLGNPMPALELRSREARIAQSYAVAAIDTSDGFVDALWTLKTVNPGLEFQVDLSQVPIAESARETARRRHVAPETFLLGSAGEYELIYAVPDPLADSLRQELTRAGLTHVGRVAPGWGTGIVFLKHGEPLFTLMRGLPCPRAARNIKEYIETLLQLSKALFQ